MKVRPKDPPIAVDEWSRHSTGVGKQLRVDVYLDDLVAMAKQFEILMQYASRAKLVCNDRDLSMRAALLEIHTLHGMCREKLEQAAPSQQLRLQLKVERRGRKYGTSQETQ